MNIEAEGGSDSSDPNSEGQADNPINHVDPYADQESYYTKSDKPGLWDRLRGRSGKGSPSGGGDDEGGGRSRDRGLETKVDPRFLAECKEAYKTTHIDLFGDPNEPDDKPNLLCQQEINRLAIDPTTKEIDPDIHMAICIDLGRVTDWRYQRKGGKTEYGLSVPKIHEIMAKNYQLPASVSPDQTTVFHQKLRTEYLPVIEQMKKTRV